MRIEVALLSLCVFVCLTVVFSMEALSSDDSTSESVEGYTEPAGEGVYTEPGVELNRSEPELQEPPQGEYGEEYKEEYRDDSAPAEDLPQNPSEPDSGNPVDEPPSGESPSGESPSGESNDEPAQPAEVEEGAQAGDS